MTVTLSGFADEISPDPREQLAALAAESITHLELRSAWSVNVADFTGPQLAAFRAMLDDAGVRVSTIGSPVGKIPLVRRWPRARPDAPDRRHRPRARDQDRPRVLVLVRPASHRGGTGRRSSTGSLPWPRSPPGRIWCWRTDAKEIFGDTPGRCADLIASVNFPRFRATFDAANFVQCGVRPFVEFYDLLRPYLVSLQDKDALAATGEIVHGTGNRRDAGRWPRCAFGFDGFVSLVRPRPAAATALRPTRRFHPEPRDLSVS